MELDLDELPTWNKRRYFFGMFFNIHTSQEQDTLVSLKESYFKTEMEFVKLFGSKAYGSTESFLRTYYYFLGSKQVRQ